MRIPVIAGNWKMNMLASDAKKFVEAVIPSIKGTDIIPIIFAPYTLLPVLAEVAEGSNLRIGAQNMHYLDNGAFTGEISPKMLLDLGIRHVIIGHSERRQYYNETDETVNLKLLKAHECGINPILCVGETLDEREAGQEKIKISGQIEKAFKGISPEDAKNTIIAYEPIWAIGTGKTAASKDAEEMIAFIRQELKKLYGDQISEDIVIQYGGSVKPSNVKEIMNEINIDGALVGGASLKSQDFIDLVNF